MIVIYHNPESEHCKKCLEILETSKHDHEIIKYQEKLLDEEKLEKVIKLLNVPPIEIIKTTHNLWVEKFKHLVDSGLQFSNKEYIQIMIKYPEIIELPIIISGDKAIIGKPATKIFDLIN